MLNPEGSHMKKKKRTETEDLRLDPQARICPKFDETSIALFSVADPNEMGFRVVDNCAEEHIM
jgi:hypothetical protein